MHRHRIVTNGVSLSVADHGDGPPVLFCHGFPAIGSSWDRQVAAVVAAGFRAIVPDMRGYGASDAPDDAAAYMPFHTVGDLVGILDHLDLTDTILVGHDFGASVAWNAAMMRPDRFRAVFGISVAFQPLGGPSFLDRLRRAGRDDFYMFAQMDPQAEKVWADASVTIPANYYRSSSEAPPKERWNAFNAPGMVRPSPPPSHVDPGYLRQAIDAFARRGFRGPLNYYRALDLYFAIASPAFAGAKVKQPSYFLMGADDALRSFAPDEGTMREAILDLRGYVVLDGVGHWPQWEAADAVNRQLLAFLKKVSDPRTASHPDTGSIGHDR